MIYLKSSSLQNYETINFHCLSHPVYSVWLWQSSKSVQSKREIWGVIQYSYFDWHGDPYEFKPYFMPYLKWMHFVEYKFFFNKTGFNSKIDGLVSISSHSYC